jgi:hypothetical protein
MNTVEEVQDFLSFCVSEMKSVLKPDVEVTVILRDPRGLNNLALSFEGAPLDGALEALKKIVEKRAKA